jgi:hypothetical protein
MIYVRGAALTALIAALEFAGRPCEVIGIEPFDVTREQIAAVLELVADNLRSDVSTGAPSLRPRARCC